MKKTLVALSVLAAAGSAQAIELYNQDKVTVNMTGDVEVRYVKEKADGSEFKQQINDADFGFDTRYQVNDDLQVGAYWEFSGTDDNKVTAANTGDVYMALYSNSFGSIKVGKLATQIDDAGIGSDYIFGISSFISDADLSFEEAVRYDIDKGTFYGGLGFVQNKTNHFPAGIGSNATIGDVKLGARVADFDFTGYYAAVDLDTANDLKASLFALEARFSGVENLNLELGYYYNKDEDNTGSLTDSTYGLAADYTVQAWKFAGGVDYQDYDDADSVTAWFVNAGYALAPSTTAYVEVGGDNKENSEIGYGVGLKAEF